MTGSPSLKKRTVVGGKERWLGRPAGFQATMSKNVKVSGFFGFTSCE